MKKILIQVAFAGVLFSAIGANAQTVNSGRTTPYQATQQKDIELKHTKLKVKFDYAKQEMAGEAWITAYPYFYPSSEIALNAKSMLIQEVGLSEKGTQQKVKFTYANDLLKVDLGKAYAKNQEFTIYIKYIARPNLTTQKGSQAITDAKGLYFINSKGEEGNKATQIWTQGETESSSVWFPTIDSPNMKSSQEIYMTVPDKFVTLSNGILKSSIKESGGLRTDYWVMEKRHAPYLFFMGVGDYAVIKDKYKNLDVDYYVEKEYADVAKQIFGNTPEMMGFFSKKLNYEFPWPKYAQMTAQDYVSGAMENTTATLHSSAAQQKAGDLVDDNQWESTIAHELFHQWFGDLVTAESWSNLTVNESFANYSEYLWEEYKYGKDAADYHLANNTSYYIHSPKEFTKDLVRFNYLNREDMFDLVSYNKGGHILHMLRDYLGDDAFFAGLTDYLKSNEYGTGEAHQLRLSLEKVSGKDLNWFFNQWYFGAGHPEIKLTTGYDEAKKQAFVKINQTQNTLFQFPVQIEIITNGKSNKQKFWAEAKADNTFYISTEKKPDVINFNPAGILLCDVKESKSIAEYKTQYTYSKDYYSRWKALEFAQENANLPVAEDIITQAINDNFFRLRISAMDNITPEMLKKPSILASVEKLAQSDPKTLVQATALQALFKTKNPKYIDWFKKGMTSKSNAVKAISVVALQELEPAAIGSALQDLDLGSLSPTVMQTLIPIIIEKKIASQQKHIAQIVAFYPFIKMQDPKKGAQAEEGFNWIMDTDSPAATSEIVKLMKQAKSQIPNDPRVRELLRQTIDGGIARKQAAKQSLPNATVSLDKQVAELKTIVELYK